MKKTLFVALSVSLFGVPAFATTTPQTQNPNTSATEQSRQHTRAAHQHAKADSSDLQDGVSDVKKATNVVRKMESQPDVANLLQKAKGVFLVPDYGRAAIGVGGSGGSGVLIARENGRWSNPVFYNMGSASVGLQAGVTAGQVAMILMTDNAVNSFKGNNTFSLNANAGLSIVNYSARGQASVGKGDIVLWSDTEGVFAGASVQGSTITADRSENHAYYNSQNATPASILNGKISVSRPEVATLRSAISNG